MNQFIGQTIPVTVDALSGATVTSKAIEAAINSIEVAAPAVEEVPAEPVVEEVPAEVPAEEEIDDGSLTASAQGIRSEVTVKVWLDAEGKITDLVIDSSNETPGFGTRCAQSELFISRFIGQTLPVEVDALASATITSCAVVEAVNSLAK